MEETDIVACLAALAQPVRLRVFRALVGAGADGLTPGSLAATLGVPPATLSFHLKELTHAGLASQRRDGRHLVYRASVAPVDGLVAYLNAHCCPGAASLDACVGVAHRTPAASTGVGVGAAKPLPARD